MDRVIAVVDAEDKYEAITALEMLLEKVKEYDPSEKVNEKAIVTDEGDDIYR